MKYLACLLLLLSASCASAPLLQSEPTDKEGVAGVKFTSGLLDKPNATLADVYRCGYMIMKIRAKDMPGSRAKLTPAAYRTALEDAGVIGSDSRETNTLATNYDAAYVLARAMDAKGGVLWTLTSSARSAHREMVDRGYMPRGKGSQYISGPALNGAYGDILKALEE